MRIPHVLILTYFLYDGVMSHDRLITLSIDIDCPPGELFEIVANPQLAPLWQQLVVVVHHPGPVHRGDVMQVHINNPSIQLITITITRLIRGREIEFTRLGPARTVTRYTVAPNAHGGSTFYFYRQVDLKVAFSDAVEAVVDMARDQAETDLHRLKTLAERQPT